MVAFAFSSLTFHQPWVTGRPLNKTKQHVRISSPSTVTSVLQTSPSESSSLSSPSPSPPTVNDTARDDEAWESLKRIIPFETLRTISKPGQYLGNEFGVINKPWHSVNVRFCLAYPDLYSIGMSSTGHVILYSCLNEEEGILCDRSYLPGADMQQALQKHNHGLFGVESKRALREFDVVGMSLSYELGATNCIKLMQLASIPYTWKERDEQSSTFRGGSPLIFAGGITVTANPEPYADLFDFFSIGDGEEMLPEIARFINDTLTANPAITRHDLLLKLAQNVSGVYVPRFYDAHPDGAVRPNRDDVPAKIQKRNSLPEPWRATSLVPVSDPVHDRLTIEIRRGCTRGCRFCLPGNVQRPARDVEPEMVKDTVIKGLKETGYNEFSLLSLSCSDWLSLPAVGISLKNELKKQEESISLSLGSQRVDRFDENIANVIGGLKQSGLTFAPEAGTQRLRDVINKGLTNEDLVNGVKLAYFSGYQQVKLYFMINLPSETDDDIQGIVDTVKLLQRVCYTGNRRRLALSLTISTFTPKSWTPFQWHSSSVDLIKQKQKFILKSLSPFKDVKVSFTDIMLSSMEDFIGRGDRRLGKVIIRAHELGAGMDAWWEQMSEAHGAWCQAIRENGLEWRQRQHEKGEWNIMETENEQVKGPRGWYDKIRKENLDRKNLLPKDDSATTITTTDNNTTKSPLDRPLPWDHIDVGLEKGWLRDELMKALTETLTPDCAFHECSTCGVCGDDMGNNITIPPPPIPEYDGVFKPSIERNQRFRLAFKKSGSFSFVSHLDMARMLDRLLRKASIPISYGGKFSPRPRIIIAAALPFGATADEELVDITLRKEMNKDEVESRLEGHLPQGMDIAWVKEIPVRDANVSLLMKSAHYIIGITHDDDDGDGDGDGDVGNQEQVINWNDVVERVKQHKDPVFIEKINKKGRKSLRELRSQLFDIRVATHEEAVPVLEHVGVSNWPSNAGVLFCDTELCNETALNAEGVVNLINAIMKTDKFHLLHPHRQRITLKQASK